MHPITNEMWNCCPYLDYTGRETRKQNEINYFALMLSPTTKSQSWFRDVDATENSFLLLLSDLEVIQRRFLTNYRTWNITEKLLNSTPGLLPLLRYCKSPNQLYIYILDVNTPFSF